MVESSYPRRQTRQLMVGSVPRGWARPGERAVHDYHQDRGRRGDPRPDLRLEGGRRRHRPLYLQRGARPPKVWLESCRAAPVPIVADIHFHVEMALAALEAGVEFLRLNPGNLHRKTEEIKLVARECKDRRVPVRIGVNAGSLDPRLYKKYGAATPEALVESAQHELALFAEEGFDDVKISVKASNVPLMIEAYRQLSR